MRLCPHLTILHLLYLEVATSHQHFRIYTSRAELSKWRNDEKLSRLVYELFDKLFQQSSDTAQLVERTARWAVGRWFKPSSDLSFSSFGGIVFLTKAKVANVRRIFHRFKNYATVSASNHSSVSIFKKSQRHIYTSVFTQAGRSLQVT